MNAFSKDYTPVMDTTGMSTSAKKSAAQSARRKDAMSSDDPKVRMQAALNITTMGSKVKHIKMARI